MADKFTIDMHKENMRRILRPKPAGSSMIERLRLAAQKKRIPVPPKQGIR